MEMAKVLLGQTILMVIFMGVGVLLYKLKYLTAQGAEEISKLLLRVTIPLVIVKSFLVEFSSDLLSQILWSFLVAALCQLLSLLVAGLVFRKNRVLKFAAGYSNGGFVGIPLINSVLGSPGVLMVCGYVSYINVLQWTYGVYTLTGDKKVMSPGKILKNPVLWAFVLGLVLFFLQVQVPPLVMTGLTSLTGITSPLAMIVLGTYLARMDLQKMFKGAAGYLCVALRLVIIPVLTLLLLWPLPKEWDVMKTAVLIIASAPVGANGVLFAGIFHLDAEEATRMVSLSTVLCVVTLPLIVLLAHILWGM